MISYFTLSARCYVESTVIADAIFNAKVDVKVPLHANFEHRKHTLLERAEKWDSHRPGSLSEFANAVDEAWNDLVPAMYRKKAGSQRMADWTKRRKTCFSWNSMKISKCLTLPSS